MTLGSSRCLHSKGSINRIIPLSVHSQGVAVRQSVRQYLHSNMTSLSARLHGRISTIKTLFSHSAPARHDFVTSQRTVTQRMQFHPSRRLTALWIETDCRKGRKSETDLWTQFNKHRTDCVWEESAINHKRLFPPRQFNFSTELPLSSFHGLQ